MSSKANAMNIKTDLKPVHKSPLRLDSELLKEQSIYNYKKAVIHILSVYLTDIYEWLYVNSWGKKPKKMKRSKGSGRKVAALNYENICKMRFLNLLKLEYP